MITSMVLFLSHHSTPCVLLSRVLQDCVSHKHCVSYCVRYCRLCAIVGRLAFVHIHVLHIPCFSSSSKHLCVQTLTCVSSLSIHATPVHTRRVYVLHSMILFSLCFSFFITNITCGVRVHMVNVHTYGQRAHVCVCVSVVAPCAGWMMTTSCRHHVVITLQHKHL